MKFKKNKMEKQYKLKTSENFHNFHFGQNTMPSSKWKNKELYFRQIAYDTPNLIETWFVVDPVTMQLYVFFEPFGTKENPRIIKLTLSSPVKLKRIPEKYLCAITYLAGMENSILAMLCNESYDSLSKIKTTAQFYKTLSIYATP